MRTHLLVPDFGPDLVNDRLQAGGVLGGLFLQLAQGWANAGEQRRAAR
jgi:hypothetical protein